MARYLLSRIISMGVSIIIVSIVIFLLMHAIPGGPFDESKMPLSPAAKANIMKKFGLDQPLYVQYMRYMAGALRFDFGYSYQSPGETVAELIMRTLPVSATVGGIGLALGVVLGMILGILAAIYRNSWIDYFTTTLSTSAITLPVFVVAIVLVFLFSLVLHWLPTGGWGGTKYWILPSITYSLLPLGTVARYTRASLLEVRGKQFITVAKAKGLSNLTIISKHMLKNALGPILTVTLPMIPGIMTGSIFVEQIFNVPGLGKYFVTSIMKRDYPLEMALILMVAVMIGLTYLVTDILYAIIDPRVRFGGGDSD